jgi:hypothetical protein
MSSKIDKAIDRQIFINSNVDRFYCIRHILAKEYCFLQIMQILLSFYESWHILLNDELKDTENITYVILLLYSKYQK